MPSPDAWSAIADLTIFYIKSGIPWDQVASYARWAYADQYGEGPASDLTWDEWSWVTDHVWRSYIDQGMSNTDVAAELISNVQPYVANVQGNTPEAPGGVLTSEQRSAKANLDGFLSDYGLDSLGDFVWQEYLNNIPVEQIMLDIRDRPEYIARFPYMKALQEKGHAMSEAEAIAYEKQVAGFARAVGMPPEMFDQPSDFTPLIENELSVQEVAQRIEDWVKFADSAPEANKIALQRLYGVGPGDIAAYFMDPEKALPLLEKQASAALTSVSAEAAGYGELSQAEAEYVGGLGYQPEQTREGFGNLVSEAELFNPIEGGEDFISRQQQLQAMFGANAGAQAAIEKQASRRLAQFQAGGSYSAGKEGITGVGSAR